MKLFTWPLRLLSSVLTLFALAFSVALFAVDWLADGMEGK